MKSLTQLQDTKCCTGCNKFKYLNEFTIRNDTGKHKSKCKQCIKEATVLRRYNISLEDYDRLLEDQGYCCAICGSEDPKAARFHIDHNHKTNEVRGLLCATCNQGIGLLQDSPNVILKAAQYLISKGHYGNNE